MIKFSGSILILLSVLSSCISVDKEEVIGVYSSELKNNADTLILHSDGVYTRNLYNKKNLVFSHRGEWRFDNGRLSLTEFFIDLDEKYSAIYSFDTGVIGLSTSVEWKKERLIIPYGPYEHDRFYFVKID